MTETNLVVQPSKRAVIYLRVSTSAQAETDYSSEGYSIPAQREACRRTAERFDAVVVDEYVDRGESARSADRPQLQAMLRRLKTERDIDYIIVHKVDRLARNRADDVAILTAIHQAGAQLVSATENIDETPSGKLLHGIMATIAEFYSQNLGAEAKKGLHQKAKLGGTPNRAPLGYLNVGERIEGREIRTVIVDPDRAPHIRWAFETYSTGDYLIREVAEALAERGLRTRPEPASPDGRTVTIGMLEKILASPYYVGIVRFAGTEYPGRHEPLIERELWDRVQAIKAARSKSAEKPSKHPHYLKGSIFCSHCGTRMGVTKAKNRHGTVYPYFYCLGRQRDRACYQRHVLIETIERRVEDLWAEVQIPAVQIAAIRRAVSDYLDRQHEEQRRALKNAESRIRRLDAERTKLMSLYYADAVPIDMFRAEQTRITREMTSAEARLQNASDDLEAAREGLDQALALVADCHRLYLAASPTVRRQLNQAIFEHIWIEQDGIEGVTLREPFARLVGPTMPARDAAEGRYARRSTRGFPPAEAIEAALRQIFEERKEVVLTDDLYRSSNPEPFYGARGSNLFFMAEASELEPERWIQVAQHLIGGVAHGCRLVGFGSFARGSTEPVTEQRPDRGLVVLTPCVVLRRVHHRQDACDNGRAGASCANSVQRHAIPGVDGVLRRAGWIAGWRPGRRRRSRRTRWQRARIAGGRQRDRARDRPGQTEQDQSDSDDGGMCSGLHDPR